jgi:hypothetical protein
LKSRCKFPILLIYSSIQKTLLEFHNISFHPQVLLMTSHVITHHELHWYEIIHEYFSRSVARQLFHFWFIACPFILNIIIH